MSGPTCRAAAASLASAVEQVERDMIQTALDRSRGNISETARLLGLTRRGLYLKLRRLGLDARAELDTTNLDTEYSVSTVQWILSISLPQTSLSARALTKSQLKHELGLLTA